MDTVELIKSGLENSTRGVKRTLDGMTADELKWHPRPDANSIGLILLHMARSEDNFIMSLIQGKKQVWETGGWYKKLGKTVEDAGAHYTEEQVAGFVVPDIEALQAYAGAVREQTLNYLEKMNPEKLDAKVEFPPDRHPPFQPVVGGILLMNVTHLAQHAGEISYIRGLKRGMDK